MQDVALLEVFVLGTDDLNDDQVLDALLDGLLILLGVVQLFIHLDLRFFVDQVLLE